MCYEVTVCSGTCKDRGVAVDGTNSNRNGSRKKRIGAGGGRAGGERKRRQTSAGVRALITRRGGDSVEGLGGEHKGRLKRAGSRASRRRAVRRRPVRPLR